MVEPRSSTSPSSSFTGRVSVSSDSDFIETFLVTSSKEDGVADFNDSINSVVAINSDYNAASDINPISTSEKLEVTSSILSIAASTSVSVFKQFLARTFIPQPRRIVTNEISTAAWPTHYSNVYNLFPSSSFNENGCTVPTASYMDRGDKFCNEDSNVTLPDYFQYCLFNCVTDFCTTNLK